MSIQVHSYRDLVVWQKSMDLVVLIYQCTETFPKSEIYGLVSQMRRSAVSIPSNIAEGRRRSTANGYRQFLHISYASGAELETQVEISERLHFGSKEHLQRVSQLLHEVMRMLNAMISNLGSSSKKLTS
ncbi:MAG: four helix bundle protein [Candidatus Peribacteraceae bacterium]|nr:four helix bundle protein [Candidatus Peribacteraceae bacterium]MDD5742735.1 four helix bundle protein [Candidatus Peribacteraceae bacterium]